MSNAVVRSTAVRRYPPYWVSARRVSPPAGKFAPASRSSRRRRPKPEGAGNLRARCCERTSRSSRSRRRSPKRCPNIKTPLVPKNVPWFTVRARDFPNPEIAQQILDAFGEDRGDGVTRLYRFPVVFPSDMWQAVMPHELVAWGANEKKFWCEYSPDGRVRYCKCYAPVPSGPHGKRAIRIFGGRKTMLRQENGGLCDPELCREYQNRQCNLSGRFIFFIPGIKSISAFELHTNSFYAMNAAIQKFETIAFMRGGRLSGFLDGKRTLFYFTRYSAKCRISTRQGRAVRVPHWIIELEAPVDVTRCCMTTKTRKWRSSGRNSRRRFSKAPAATAISR